MQEAWQNAYLAERVLPFLIALCLIQNEEFALSSSEIPHMHSPLLQTKWVPSSTSFSYVSMLFRLDTLKGIFLHSD